MKKQLKFKLYKLLTQWDTAGQERYRSITNAYYRGAEAIIIVYDITNKESFLHIQEWIDEISKYTGTNICKLVLGNKCDVEKERAVSKEDIAEFEKKTGIRILEVSAKTGQGVDNAFRIIVESLISRK